MTRKHLRVIIPAFCLIAGGFGCIVAGNARPAHASCPNQSYALPAPKKQQGCQDFGTGVFYCTYIQDNSVCTGTDAGYYCGGFVDSGHAQVLYFPCTEDSNGNLQCDTSANPTYGTGTHYSTGVDTKCAG